MLTFRGRLLMFARTLVVAVVTVGISGCGSTMQVSRVAVDQTIDLSGNWNDSDSRMVSTELINSMLQAPWIENFLVSEQGNSRRKPVVVVGRVYNNTDEHINPGTFLGDIELAMVNSGRSR